MKKKILAFLSLAAMLSCGFVPSARRIDTHGFGH